MRVIKRYVHEIISAHWLNFDIKVWCRINLQRSIKHTNEVFWKTIVDVLTVVSVILSWSSTRLSLFILQWIISFWLTPLPRTSFSAFCFYFRCPRFILFKFSPVRSDLSGVRIAFLEKTSSAQHMTRLCRRRFLDLKFKSRCKLRSS